MTRLQLEQEQSYLRYILHQLSTQHDPKEPTNAKECQKRERENDIYLWWLYIMPVLSSGTILLLHQCILLFLLVLEFNGIPLYTSWKL